MSLMQSPLYSTPRHQEYTSPNINRTIFSTNAICIHHQNLAKANIDSFCTKRRTIHPTHLTYNAPIYDTIMSPQLI